MPRSLKRKLFTGLLSAIFNIALLLPWYYLIIVPILQDTQDSDKLPQDQFMDAIIPGIILTFLLGAAKEVGYALKIEETTIDQSNILRLVRYIKMLTDNIGSSPVAWYKLALDAGVIKTFNDDTDDYEKNILLFRIVFLLTIFITGLAEHRHHIYNEFQDYKNSDGFKNFLKGKTLEERMHLLKHRDELATQREENKTERKDIDDKILEVFCSFWCCAEKKNRESEFRPNISEEAQHNLENS